MSTNADRRDRYPSKPAFEIGHTRVFVDDSELRNVLGLLDNAIAMVTTKRDLFLNERRKLYEQFRRDRVNPALDALTDSVRKTVSPLTTATGDFDGDFESMVNSFVESASQWVESLLAALSKGMEAGQVDTEAWRVLRRKGRTLEGRFDGVTAGVAKRSDAVFSRQSRAPKEWCEFLVRDSSDASSSAVSERERSHINTSRWPTVTEVERITDINRGVISRAADSGELCSNGRKGRDRRIDPQGLVDWVRFRLLRGECSESVEHVANLIRKHVND